MKKETKNPYNLESSDGHYLVPFNLPHYASNYEDVIYVAQF